MNDSPLQLTKREMHALATRRQVWIAVLAAGVVLGLAGPFGTDDVMRGLPRVVYWIVVAIVGFFGGSAVSTLIAESLRGHLSRWPTVVLAGVGSGIVLTLALIAMNTAVFGPGFIDPALIVPLAINVVVISVTIGAAYVLMRGDAPSGALPPDATPQPPRILSRVPIDKRGRLYALSVQDHYVEVITDRGSELVLLRLADAMGEVGTTPGLQVHRSHWVATGAVAAAKRDGAKAVLTLQDGRDIPVSRTYLPAVKEAGLLPG